MSGDQIRSQALGLSLGLITAIGVIAYERLVKTCSYFTVGFLVSLSYVPFWLASLYVQDRPRDWVALNAHKWAVLIFLASGATGPIWYAIVRKQNAVVGATYEVKYIVMMAIIYLFFGETRITWNTVVGVVLALTSVYFISKP